jgi:suppressor of ftsI
MNVSSPRRPRAVAFSVSIVAVASVVITAALTGCGSFLGGGVVSTVGDVDFDSPLAIPPLAPSVVNTAGERVFELKAREGAHRFHPTATTPTWGFNQDYLGPTLVADRGETVRVNVRNDLPEATSVHWHGMHLPAEMDGGPHQQIAPFDEWSPTWTIDQPASTLWYHPHLHGTTEKHVARGLAGMFLVRDPIEDALPLPRQYGVDDFPVIVQDLRLGDDGSLQSNVRGFSGLLGDEVAVNGTIGPYLSVSTDVVRLRLLNASTARVYRFGLADDRELAVIGTDGGLLERPHVTSLVQLSPGERAEVLVTMVPGETVVLRSFAPDLGIDRVPASMNGGGDTFDVLELRASPALASVGRVPSTLASIERLGPATVERNLEFNGTTINNESMQMNRIDETVALGSTEAWVVRNTQDQPHSFHVHDVQFQVESVDGAPPGDILAGWKDTIYLRPDTEYRLLMRFSDYSDPNTPYMYHCHLLWHEDRGMMGQFVVVKDGEEADVAPGGTHNH